MPDTTFNLGLSYLLASQADKHVSVNDSLDRLDALVMGALGSRKIVAPPTAPVQGAGWIVPAAATGLWSGKAGLIAFWRDSVWVFIAPKAGWVFWVSDENRHIIWSGTKWQSLSESSATGAFGNMSFGQAALNAITTGTDNLAIGDTALTSTTTSSHNIALGKSSMFANTTGGLNCAIGNFALYNNSTGSENVAVGYAALVASTTGTKNSALGLFALYGATTGNQNTGLGNYALSSLSTFNNCTGVGFNSQVTADHQIQLGDSRTTVYAFGGIQSRSDRRDKCDIRETVFGLDFIMTLRPVDFRWNYREDYNALVPLEIDGDAHASGRFDDVLSQDLARSRFHCGLIAQEVEDAAKRLGADFGGLQHHKVSGGEDVYTLSYDALVGPLIKAVQTLTSRIEKLEAIRAVAK